MKRTSLIALTMLTAVMLASAAHADKLKPYILGKTPPGNMTQVVAKVEDALKAQGFRVLGKYKPFPSATVIAATNDELLQAAAKTENGGFGAAQRVAVSEYDGKLQVAYVNPAYIGTAYGMGKLRGVSAKLKAALGAEQEFGAEGVDEKKLAPGKYHYAMMMPYFDDVTLLNRFPDYKTAVATVERNLAAGKGGTVKVYRVDIPGKNVSVFGVGIVQGDGLDSGAKDTDKEILDIIDYQQPRSTPYLPYELMVKDDEVIALPGRYRIAVHFPDTKMIGKHGFTKIMSSPGGIKRALEAVAGYSSEKGFAASQ